MSVKQTAVEWKLIGHSFQIADTGDYGGHYEITNGKISLLTTDDDDEALQPIVDALNDSRCRFYENNYFEVECRLKEYQISDLQSRLDLAVKALEKFTILNLDHYKDIAGLIKNATDTLTQIKGGSDDNG